MFTTLKGRNNSLLFDIYQGCGDQFSVICDDGSQINIENADGTWQPAHGETHPAAKAAAKWAYHAFEVFRISDGAKMGMPG